MTTKKSPSRRPALPMPAQTDYTAHVHELAETVARLQPTARRLILEGLFCPEDTRLSETIEALARETTDRDQTHQKTTAAMAVLRRCALRGAAAGALNTIDDAMWQLAADSGHAGYLLGIAVGLLLRPETFTRAGGAA